LICVALRVEARRVLVVLRAVAVLRAGFLAFVVFAPALGLRVEALVAVAIWVVLLFFLVFYEKRGFGFQCDTRFVGIEHLFVTRS